MTMKLLSVVLVTIVLGNPRTTNLPNLLLQTSGRIVPQP